MNLLCALILSFISFALPSNNALNDTALDSSTGSDTSMHDHLVKRGRFGWIMTFAADDPTCSKGYLNNFRPKIHESCVIFEAPDGANDYIGINWGGQPLDFTSLQGYRDKTCTNPVGRKISVADRNNSGWRGVNTCVKISDHGGPWGSVKGLGVYFTDG